MTDITEYNEEEFEVVEFYGKDNNEIAESRAHKESKSKNYEDANDMYIKELFEMKDKIKEVWDSKWWTPNLIDQWRKINNDIEQVVWIKKDKSALYLLNDIREKGKALYMK